MQKIVPHLWFDKEVKEAVDFYCAIFPDSTVLNSMTLHDTPSGDAAVISFRLGGYEFMAINGGPYFTFNSSISFMLNFDPAQDDQAEVHLKEIWGKLANGGTALMPLQEYPFSKLYGWVKDRFGVSWQLVLTDPAGEPRPFIIPSLMFAGDKTNKAEEAVQFYLSVFKDTKQGAIARYTEDTGPAKKDSLLFTDFMLEKQWFAAMDSGVAHQIIFNEAISLVVRCDTQEEIDYYWDKLSAVAEAEQCGWLKDKYGVSWQVVPTAMDEMMQKGTPEQIARVTKAFLQMKKFDLAELNAAFKG